MYFLDYFEDGLSHLSLANTDGAEMLVSQALKALSGSPNASLLGNEKAKCFHTLAEIYLARASKQLDNDCFCEMMVKSIALFEAERMYKHGSYKEYLEVDTAVSAAELKFVDKVFGRTGVERFEKMSNSTNLNRKKLKEIRSKVSDDYFPRLEKFPDWDSGNENKRCEEIESIYKEIHTDIKCFLNDIFRYCCQVAGPAPCAFSIIGLGSMSRKEVTPYSDLEFAILLDHENKTPSPEQRQYFRFLTYLIQVQIIKLGETVLPSLGISSLNDFYSKSKEDDWFFDDVIPKGFSFDGMMPWACKTPLGRKEWRGLPRQEYIMTIDEMLELQDVIPGSSFENAKTANVFSSVCHLFGEEKLTTTYEQKLSLLLRHADRQKGFQKQVLGIMEMLLEIYGDKGINIEDSGTQQDVKNEVYRLTSLLIEQLSKFFGIFGQSSWQCIQELSKQKVLTVDKTRNLLVALGITTELRLKCYQNQNRQKEALPTVPQLSDTDCKNNPCPSTAAIVRLYQTLIPFKSVVREILEELKNHSWIDPELVAISMLNQVNFMDDSPVIRGTAYVRILQLPKAFECLLSAKDSITNGRRKVKPLLMLLHCYLLVGKFQEAFECWHTLHTTMSDEVNRSDLLTASTMLMNGYVEQGLYQEAVKVHQQIEDFGDGTSLEATSYKKTFHFLNSYAVLLIRTNQLDKAEVILRRILERLAINQRKHYFNRFVCLNNLAVVLLNEDKLAEARNILNTALGIASELYGNNAVHPYFARCLTNLSEVHYYLGDIQEADRLVQLALIIYSHIHEQKLIEPSIIDALITKARIYQFYKQWDEMSNSLEKANEIANVLYNGQPHSNVAYVLYCLGHCERERGKFSEALNYFQKYLKVHEDERKECRQSDHDCKTANVLVRIANLGEQCLQDQSSYSLSCAEKALQIEEEIHGKGSNHGHVAICRGSLGYHMIKANLGTEGLKNLESALQMFEENNFVDVGMYSHVQITLGNVLGEHSPDKAEKHLKDAAAVLKTTLTDDSHVTLIQVNSSLLMIFLQTNRIPEGLELAKKQKDAIDTMLSKSSMPSFQCLSQIFHLAAFYASSGQQETAKKMYIGLIARLEGMVDPKDSTRDALMVLLLMTEQRVGEIYQANKMFHDAESMFQRIASLVQKTTSQRPVVREARHVAQLHLASIFTETGRHQQATELLQHLINIHENAPESIDTRTASCAFLTRAELKRRCNLCNLALLDLEKASKIAQKFRATAIRKGMMREANKLHAKIMNITGLVYEQTNELERALECYICCLGTVEDTPVTIDTATFHQNAADTLKKLGRLVDSLLHYKKSLEIREMLFSENTVREDIATVLYHIASIYCAKERAQDAFEALDKLLPLREELLKRDGPDSLQNYCAAVVMKGNCHLVRPDEAQQAKDAYEEAEKVLKRMTEGQISLDYAVVLGNAG